MSHFKDARYSNPSIQRVATNWDKKYNPLFELVKKTSSDLIRRYYKKIMGVGLQDEEAGKRQQINIHIKPIAHESLLFRIEREFGDLDFEEFQKLKAFLVAAENAHNYFRNTPEHYDNLSKLIELTRQKLSLFDLEGFNKRFIEILFYEDADVFGRYYKGATSTRSEIDLYIVPCVLFCEANNLDLTTFVTMVLAHELAHGYNHLGVDKDNYHWENFWETEESLAEGLAQYYTREFLEKHGLKLPRGIETFEYLLEHQSDAYKSFQKWQASPEKIYSAFIEARRNNICKNAEYLKLLDGAKQRIKGDRKLVTSAF